MSNAPTACGWRCRQHMQDNRQTSQTDSSVSKLALSGGVSAQSDLRASSGGMSASVTVALPVSGPSAPGEW